MGLFGKKKTPEALLAEGRAQYESGDMKHMFLTLHGLANKGDPEACYYIGIYWLKEKSDKRMAEKYLTIAARGGQTDAAKLLAEQLGVGDKLPEEESPAQSPKTALELFREGEAAEEAGDLSSALFLFEQAARMGDADAQFNCGVMYSKGQGAAADPVKALYWYEQAAQQGETYAQFNLAMLYYSGRGTAEDKAKALAWFEKAAQQGYADAQFNCGIMYASGQGAAASWDKANLWLGKAASQGHEQAKKALAALTPRPEPANPDPKPETAPRTDQTLSPEELERLFSQGVAAYDAKDYTKALSLLEKAAQQGHAQAQFNCGVMYNNGAGTAVDKTKALYWWEKAAQQGDAKAQFNCGGMYYNGEGTAADKARAKLYFQKAADQTANKEVQEKAKKILRDRF